MLEIKYINQEESINSKEETEQESLSETANKNLNTCGFGDEFFFFENEYGNPKYENIEEQWKIFIEWVEKIAERKKEEVGEEAEYAYDIGREVLKWARQRDPYGLYMLTRVHWVGFRDTYLTEDAPKIVREFIDEIMYNKMTDKEKWGTDEDRMLQGQLIICSNTKMTPEESYRLTMKERRQKYDPKKHAERVKKDLDQMLQQAEKEHMGNFK